ncbi:MAG: hypothetical protein QM749_08560 [Aquabacterium sp.]
MRARHGRRRGALLLSSVVLLATLLQGCGGGGGGAAPTTHQTDDATASGLSAKALAMPIHGYVVDGAVAQASVSLYQVQKDGYKTLVATTQTDANGAYGFDAPLANDTVFLIDASGGQYTDDVTRLPAVLSTHLRAVGVWQSTTLQVSVSPYSEIAVRILEHKSTPDWRASAVNAANSTLSEWVGVDNMLDFRPADLTSQQDLTAFSNDELLTVWNIGGFSGFRQRLPAVAGMDATENALNKLYLAVTSDRYEDDVNPPLTLGFLDFTNMSNVSAEFKQYINSMMLTGGATMPSGVTQDQAKPHGTSSGVTSASMPDDQFLVIPPAPGTSLPLPATDAPVGTMFDARGALVAYQTGAGQDQYRGLFSASVADVYGDGDGDVGFGRWNGGLAGLWTRTDSGLTQFTQPDLVSTTGESYAVARPATGLPSCGLIKLNQAASLAPFSLGDSGTALLANGLSSDARMAVQYVGGVAHLAFDLGIQTPSGTVQRFTSTGGLAAPWSSGVTADAHGRFTLIANATMPALIINGALAGQGGHKAIVRIVFAQDGHSYTEQVVVFNAPDATVDATGCATSAGSTGAGVSGPLPVSGSGYFFAPTSAYAYASNATVGFGAHGQVTAISGPTTDYQRPTVNFAIPEGAPTYELAGNAIASIGRAGGDLLGGDTALAFVPYAVAKPTLNLPVVGAQRYQMVASTAVVSKLTNAAGTGLAPGQVTSASVTVDFDQSTPPGAPPLTLLQNKVGVSISGTFAGMPFTITNPSGSGTPQLFTLQRGAPGNPSVIYDGGVIGTIAGPNGEYVVLVFQTTVNGIDVHGAILLKAQP